MSIPNYKDLMLPFLKQLSDEKHHTLREIRETLAGAFSLSEEEYETLLPSGNQRVFENRVGWARTYLKKAGLLAAPQRGVFTITARGLEVLRKNPSKLDNHYLEQFPEFIDFKTKSASSTNDTPNNSNNYSDITPEESLELAHQKLKDEISSEILSTIQETSPYFFEKLVVDLLIKMGYGGSRKEAGQAVGKSGDEGIDGIIKEDRLGLDIIYLQAKRWASTVGRPEIQKFAGALQGQRARKGVFITTSNFSKEAEQYASHLDSKIILIDGERLCDLMIEYNVGVTPENTYEVKKLDSDYFTDGQ